MAKLTCPHCGTSLARKLIRGKPLPRERKILPDQAVLVCPSCQGDLHPNPHPAGLWVWLAWLPFAVLLNFAMLQFIPMSGHNKVWPAALFGAFLLGTFVTIYVHFKFLRNWPRFSDKPSRSRLPFMRRRG